MNNTRTHNSSFRLIVVSAGIALLAGVVAAVSLFMGKQEPASRDHTRGQKTNSPVTERQHSNEASPGEPSSPNPEQSASGPSAVQDKQATIPKNAERQKPTKKPKKSALSSASSSDTPEFRTEASDAVLAAVGRDPNVKGYRARANALRKLDRSLEPPDVETLRAFIRARPGDHSMRPIEYNALRNDALSILLQQNERHPEIIKDIAHVFRNPEQGDNWRSYVLQYFPAYWERHASRKARVQSEPDFSTVTDPSGRAALELTRDILNEATEERSGPVAGTALLSMIEMSHENGLFSRKDVKNVTLEILRDTTSSEASRMTALRIAARLDVQQAVKNARTLAQTGQSAMARMVAIRTLGDLGSKREHNLLASLAETNNERIRRVARAALDKLEKK